MRLLLALLLVAGLFSALGTSVGAACPRQSPAAMPMMHHRHQPLPARADPLACAACLAVLPALAAAAPHSSIPFLTFLSLARPLAGIAHALDPPPPRAA